MSEQATEQTESQEGAAAEQAEQQQETFDAEYVKKLRAEAARYRTDAKNATAELEKQRAASMTEAERAVAEAEAKGRKAAASEFGTRLVQSEYVAAAARRNPNFDAAAVLEDINLARFLTETGEPDTDAITASVQRLIPEGSAVAPSFDGGVRGSTAATAGPEADFAKFLSSQLGQRART